MVMNDTRIYQKMTSKSLLSVEQNIREWEKCLIIIIRNYNDLVSSLDEEYKYVLGNQFRSLFKRKFSLKMLI